MSWIKEVLQDFHSRLTPVEFEKLIYALLNEMGFSDLALTGRSGDGGIDLTGGWTPRDFALRIKLDFVIQAKRTDPNKSLNPIYLRALKGSMKSGQYGLLITTGRISSRSREEGLKDPDRIVSTVSGSDLVKLCAQNEIGVRPEYNFDRSFLKPKSDLEEPPEPPPAKASPEDLSKILTTALGEAFERVGRTSIYKSNSTVLIARWSQRYRRKGQNYWYGLTVRDMESIENHKLTHFAYVCSNVGVVLLSVSMVKKHIQMDTLGRSPKIGPLRHYHIQFDDSKGELKWVLKNGVRENIESYFKKARD